MSFSHFFIPGRSSRRSCRCSSPSSARSRYTGLAVNQLPEIVPPTIIVSTSYPGASAQTVADTVAAPIEQEINGVEGMIYMYSQATNDGSVSITVSFDIGIDIDRAQVLVQNRVQAAERRLPDEVRRNGLTVRKRSPDVLLAIHLLSPDKTYDQVYISNYGLLNVRDRLMRVEGVGDVAMFGAREYSMRIWLDPERIAMRNLTAEEVLVALRSQNVQVAGGAIGEPPTKSGTPSRCRCSCKGRLRSAEEFNDIIVKTGADGRVVRLKDVGKAELGALSYCSYRLCRPLPGDRAGDRPAARLQRAEGGRGGEEGDRGDRPSRSRRASSIASPTIRPSSSMSRSRNSTSRSSRPWCWSSSWCCCSCRRGGRRIIPVVAIPISLIGTFAVMQAAGFSLNMLTLFGLVLAVGIVVDDAIVVVENVETQTARGHATPRSRQSLDGRGRRGADRHRAGAVGRVHSDRVRVGHHRPVLSPVRDHRRNRDADLGVRVVDPVAGARGAAVAAARARTASAR